MTLAPDDPRHGTVNGYQRGCHCDRCKRAAAAKQRDWTHRTGRRRPRAEYLAELRAREPIPHGTEAKYVHDRCRCGECREAASAARRERRRRAAA